MLDARNVSRYYLFAFSNFIAAFGGGMILGKGIGAITNTFIVQGGSILAFFVGTVLGLVFLQFVPSKFSKTLAYSFSFCGSLASLYLLYLFNRYSFNGKITGLAAFFFFFLLTIRFGFWFYSRVFRASEVAGQQQKIAWVEFGYYAGMICGLIIWEILGVDLGMNTALVIDALLQFTAGSLDIFANRFQLITKLATNQQSIKKNSNDESSNQAINETLWRWRLAIAVIFLTIGIQVVTFGLAHQVSERLGYYILAFFYIGVSIAAIICNRFKIRLEWHGIKENKLGYASIYYYVLKKEKNISFFLISILSLFSVLIAILGVSFWHWSTLINDNDLILPILGNRSILLFVAIAAFFYEVLALSILDRIGFEEKLSNYKGMVMRTYGLMGMGAAISFWLIGILNNSFFGLIFILSSCLTFSIFAIWRRTAETSIS